MAKTRTLTEQDVRLLQSGDKLILDVVAGAHNFGQNAADLTKHFKGFGLNHGETYTFSGKAPLYKRGEGTFLGWCIHVQEERGEPQVAHEYYAATPDLEARLAERIKK